MTKRNDTRPPAVIPMRRKDRAMQDEAEIREMLRSAPYGVLATVMDGQPYINSNLFVYDEGQQAIFLHTALTGQTRSNLETGGRVCFHVSEMGRLLPAAEALEFSVEYRGVTVFGMATVVQDPSEMRRALQMLLDKYFFHLRPGIDYRAITEDELQRTSVYRIEIEQWGGKSKQASPDFPGAFYYGQD